MAVSKSGYMTTGGNLTHDAGGGGGGDTESLTQTQKQLPLVFRRRDAARIATFFAATSFLFLAVYHSASHVLPLPQLFRFSEFGQSFTTAKSRSGNADEGSSDGTDLARILREASTVEKTVIITTLNRAWAEPNSTFDVFLEGFRAGKGTEGLLRHVVVACLDETALSRCSEVHDRRRCYLLKTDGVDFSGDKEFMSPDYLRMMWRRIDFLADVLRLRYNFLFTDADIVWLRNPFPHLYANADFQIACDYYNGNSSSVQNAVNGGFTYVTANRRTQKFYEFWYSSRMKFPGRHDQDVFNRIKFDPYIAKIGLKMRFLDTNYFSGFCQISRDMNKVCTMHANCCIGQVNKVKDLRRVLEDWKTYLSSKEEDRRKMMFRRPEICPESMRH